MVLETVYSDEELEAFDVLMWLPIPVAQRVPIPEFETSLPEDLQEKFSPAALNAALTLLRSGEWKEVRDRVAIDKRTTTGALRTVSQRWAAFQAAALARYTFLSNAQDARAITDDLYGTYYDDQTGAWTLG